MALRPDLRAARLAVVAADLEGNETGRGEGKARGAAKSAGPCE
ncbi:MAG: hypothetical protein R3F05_00880 [Planctomycetota bacterium]